MEEDESETTEASSHDAPAVASSAEPETTVAHQDLSAWRGKELIDRDGERIGTLEDVYFDIETEQAQFGTVKQGFFDRHLTFVPLTRVTVGPDSIQVAVTKQLVNDAPNMENEGDALTQADEALLYHYYQLVYTPSGNPSGRRLARR